MGFKQSEFCWQIGGEDRRIGSNGMSQYSNRDPLLKGTRILDLSRVMSGPYCTSMLSDLGAEIIKIEMPSSGDEARFFGPYKEGESTYFILLNRDKKSVTINLKMDEGIQLIKQLIRQSDVLVENFRPGVMRRLGLDYDSIKAMKPNIIYTSISGFGLDSPMAGLPAFDLVIQAMSGLMNLTGFSHGPATAIGESLADVCTGMFAAWGIVAALFHRERTGEGRHIDVSMLDSMFAMQLTGLSQRLYFDKEPERVGNRHPVTYPVDSFATKDGAIVLVAFTDAVYQNLAHAMGKPELVDDPQFIDNSARNKNEDLLRSIISDWTQSETTAEILSILHEAKVPCASVWSLGQVMESEHQKIRHLVDKGQHSKLGEIPLVPQPVKFNGEGMQDPQHVPQLGEDTESVLMELLDISENDLATLRQKGVI